MAIVNGSKAPPKKFENAAERYLTDVGGTTMNGFIRYNTLQRSIAALTAKGKDIALEKLAIDEIPLRRRFLFCDYFGYGCHKLIQYVGIENRTLGLGETLTRCHVLRCVKCKGVEGRNVRLHASQMNTLKSENHDWVVAVGQELDYEADSIQYIDPPIDPIFKQVEIDDGHIRYTSLQRIRSEREKYKYYAKGFFEHPDLK